MSWESEEGLPFPQGVIWVEEEQAYNFSIYSHHAESVTLLLYSQSNLIEPAMTYRLNYLKNKTGRIWHCRLSANELGGAKFYAYSIDGPHPQHRFEWHHFNAQKVLLDPYATSVSLPSTFDRAAAMDQGPNSGKAPLGVLSACRQTFDWGDDPRPRHESDLVIYELHVKGFTNNSNASVNSERRGTYVGIIDKIPYLKQLGITAVELMPVFQYDPQEGNYWGYMPLSFFAPQHAYATQQAVCACEQHNELRSMVKALHAADIEVILDVVYNHTAEGNQDGPTYSFKGIDNSTYYLISDRADDRYENFSGTGNTLHCANRYVRKMILDSMRYWVNEMHVDGFRFDLASLFSRSTDGSINLVDQQVFADIVSDPDLSRVRLIAEPWDADGVFQLGRSLPGITWSQWNGRFRDDVRRFVKGDKGMIPALMYRLYGSDDLFPDDLSNAYRPHQSVNYLTAHDGFTLYDLLSYSEKHNWENGYHNTDGTNDNNSWNCGWEGDKDVPLDVLQLRKQQAKNLCCLLFLSNGTPMLRAGDEFLQTQNGNNNAFNQDNETSWLDWSRLNANRDVLRFFQLMIAYREAHPSLGRSRFWRDDVRWYGTHSHVDMSTESQTLALCLHGASRKDVDIYIMVNASVGTATFTIQEGAVGNWKRVIDTSRESPNDFRDPGDEVELNESFYNVAPQSIVVLTNEGAIVL